MKINRRQFLTYSAATLVSTTIYNQVKAHKLTTPANLDYKGKDVQKVLVIGAGISGLVAAYELNAAGHDVKVLEGRDRIGGRILTLRGNFSNANFVEAGAARIQPNHNLTLTYAKHFGLTLVPFYPTEGLYTQVKDGEKTLVPIDQLFGNNSAETIGNWKKFAQGTDTLPQAFADALGDKIHLGHGVTHIEQNPSGVKVICQSGRVYKGDRVICTVPLPVLGKISFNPSLSCAKEMAISGGYNYRAATRTFVEFPERFWEKKGLNGWGIFWDRSEELWHTTWDNVGKTGILHSYKKGEYAHLMDTLSPEKQIATLIDEWSEILPEVKNYPLSKINTTSYSWTNDPWAKGGWAYPTEAQETTFFDELKRTEGRIHFAGDHTSITRGWIQGALESGLRVAKEINENKN